jgi:uncharacterized protein (UPF0276 family)
MRTQLGAIGSAGPEQPVVRPLGIGLPYIASLPAALYRPGLLDFVEITPETLCRQRRQGSRVAIDLVPGQLDRARQTCDSLPVVVHGVELSIGSAHGWNDAYVEMLDAFHESWPFVWHSEHLGFQTMPGEDGTTVEVGVPLPLPATEETVRLVAERSLALGKRYGVPFLLENAAHYLPGLPVDPDIGDEGGLMRAITERGQCFQLLDLHNVYCNSVNHSADALAAIDRMPLDRVLELHVAGGSWRDGFWMDAHDGRVPESVWELLEYTLPRAPNVAGVVFEMLEEHAPRIGAEAIAEELARARTIWQRWKGG